MMSEQIELEEAKLPLNQQPRRSSDKRSKRLLKEKRKSIGNITRSFALGTSSHGIPRIAASKTVHRRSIWTLVVIIVLSGYITHMTELLRHYFEYPVRIKSIVERNGSLQFPAVTVCNNNKLRLSQLLQSSDYGHVLQDLLRATGVKEGTEYSQRKRRYTDGDENKPAALEAQQCVTEMHVDRRGGAEWKTKPTERVDSSGACCKLCESTTGCVTWTFDKTTSADSGNCWLSEDNVSQVRSNCCNSGIVRRSSQDTGTLHVQVNTNCNTKENTSIIGAEIFHNGSAQRNSSDECCAFCSETPECLAWTFNTIGDDEPGNCSLKSSIESEVYQVFRYSGVTRELNKSVAINATEGIHCSIDLNVRRTGFDMTNASVESKASPEDCCAMCSDTNGCVAWEFVKHGDSLGDCHLKDYVPMPEANDCCDSGIMGIIESGSTQVPVRTTSSANTPAYAIYVDVDSNQYEPEANSSVSFGVGNKDVLTTIFDDVVTDSDVYTDFMGYWNKTSDILSQLDGESADLKLSQLIRSMSQAEIMDYGHQVQDLILECSYNQMDCTDRDLLLPMQDQTYGNCYTFDYGEGDKVIRYSLKPGSNNGLKLTLNAEQNEYIGPVSQGASFRVVIHSQNSMPFPEEKGIDIQPGTSTTLAIKLTTQERMGPPYSNCTFADQLSQFDEYSYTMLACQKECIEKYLYARCGCVDMVSELPVCMGFVVNATQEMCREFVYFLSRHELLPCNCRPTCREVQYSTTVSQKTWPSDRYMPYFMQTVAKSGLHDASAVRNNLARVEIYFEELNYIVHREVAVYLSANLWADIGGSLGLWIGISIVTLVEVLEYIIDLAVHMKRRGIQCHLLPEAETTLRSPLRT
ncbi:uncharacterized protein LOC102803246 [Saccoglossus kowalevskii]